MLTSLTVQRILLADRNQGYNGDVRHLRATSLSAPADAFCVGDNDLRGILLGTDRLLRLSDPMEVRWRTAPPVLSFKRPVRPNRRPSPKLLTPYLTGVGISEIAPANRLAVLSIPRRRSTTTNTALNGYRTHLHTRYSSALMNDTLRKLTARAASPSSTSNIAVTENGYLNLATTSTARTLARRCRRDCR